MVMAWCARKPTDRGARQTATTPRIGTTMSCTSNPPILSSSQMQTRTLRLCKALKTWRGLANPSSLKGHDLDFNDPASVMQLTKSLLKADFGLQIHLPDDRLCPPVTNRHNYIVWLKGLLDSTSYDSQPQRVGLDIGTGASCIYPLLGCAQRPWSFVATGSFFLPS
jgi:hypothetical protein